jgi:hypothetical protein
MTTTDRPHAWYLGDWVFLIGPTFVETPFNAVETKDCELRFYGQRFENAFEAVTDLICTPNWNLYRLEPGGLEEYLERSAAVTVSDVEAQCFHLYPAFFDRARRQNNIVTFPVHRVHNRQIDTSFPANFIAHQPDTPSSVMPLTTLIPKHHTTFFSFSARISFNPKHTLYNIET